MKLNKIEVDQGMRKITGMTIGEKILEVTWESIKILEDRIVEEDIEEIIGMKIIIEKGRSRSRDRSFSGNNNRRNVRSISNSRPRSGSKVWGLTEIE